MASVDYAYRYEGASRLETGSGERGGTLRLASSPGAGQQAPFFSGRLVLPRHTADLLLGLSEVVRSRYSIPPAMLKKTLAMADPVITCHEPAVGAPPIRFEGFSSCCGVYARIDLLEDAIEPDSISPGTTNVDFGPSMRTALTRLTDSDSVGLRVGKGEVALDKAGGEATIEKKVALPMRWLKGFVEVQAYQARMEPKFELAGAAARAFLRAFPRSMNLQTNAWVTQVRDGLRIGQTETSGAVNVGGIARVRALEDLARYTTGLRVYSDGRGATGWLLETKAARFHLVLSPETWRGFSGEGQALEELAGTEGEKVLGRVRAALRWQPLVDAGDLAEGNGLSPATVDQALARLGAAGLAGYDLVAGAYFHRELPFDLEAVESMQPRLKAARKLVAEGGVQIDGEEAWVRGSGVEHRVLIGGEDGPKCTCAWYAKHRNERGPCKHILATQILRGDSDDV
jgi:hypothetical protein